MAKDKDLNDRVQEDPQKAKEDFDALEASVLVNDNVISLTEYNPDLKIINELNANHIYIENFGGKNAVTMRIYDEVTGKKEISYISTETFRNNYMNRTIAIGNRPAPIGHYWLQDSRRNTVKTITFDPNIAPGVVEVNGDRYLNLWDGLAVSPKKGSWKKTRS